MNARSTKRIPSASSNPTDLNPQAPTKRKRPPHDNPGPTSWLGLAFQLPSVIKKEINDFVRTVRGSNNSQSAFRPNTNTTGNISSIESERTRRDFHRAIGQSVPAVDRHSRTHHHRSIHRRGQTPEQASSSSRIRSSDLFNLDLPSPPKKLKRSEMSSLNTSLTHELINKNPADQIANDQQQSSSHDLPESNVTQCTNSITSLPHVAQVDFAQAEVNCTDDFQSATDLPTKAKQSHEPTYGHDAEIQEIICNRPKKIERRVTCQTSGHLVGYNSVLFPDSRNHRPFDSPGSSVNADVSSSTWQASSSFSIHSGSNMHRGVSNHTSLTSNTSAERNPSEELRDKSLHTARLDSISSQPSPRIRHTKILGSPRNHHTLSASSISSIGSVLTSDFITRHNSGSQLQGGPRQALNKGISYNFSNADPPSDNERELLTSDSDFNHESPAAIQIGRRLSSHRPTLTCRRKVPLSEIIGRPLNATPSLSSLQSYPDYGRDSFKLNPSQSIASITSSFTGCSNIAHPSAPHLQSQPARECSGPSKESHCINMEEPTTSVDTSATMSVLRNQLSNTMHIGPSSPLDSSPNTLSKSLPSPRQARHQAMIMEVDEEVEDNSYEFLDRAEAQSLSPEDPNRKRKRLLRRSDLINFGRQGFAAVQQSPNKLIDLPSNPPSARSKTNVIKKLHLPRRHKRHQSSSQDIVPSIGLSEEDAQSPTKKIRILETEIARLRRELENEKTKSANRSSMFKSCNQPNELADSPHVAFSSRSPLFMSSPVSSRTSSRYRRFLKSGKEPEVTLDSPVMVKKPSDGALVGGSPFIVSRVFGQGPEVVGERTPTQAHKWLHERKLINVNSASVKLPGLAHDLFGAKSLKSSLRASLTDDGRAGSSNLNGSVGWKRDHQLAADLISTPKARTLKKIHRNSKGTTAMPPSQLRNMFGSTANESQRNSGAYIMKGRPEHSQPPDMATFLNELKASGKAKLRKTPGSTKYYMSQSFTSPTGSPYKQKSHSADIHSPSVMNSMFQSFGGRESNASYESTLSGPTEATAASTNTNDSEQVLNGSQSSSVSNINGNGRSFSFSEQNPGPFDQVKSPLSIKVYPSGNTAKRNEAGNDDSRVQIVLGEAISTPRKDKQAARFSRTLVDPHLTPRVRPLSDAIELTSTLQNDFTMDELIQQVKDLKENDTITNGEPGTHILPVHRHLQNHELVREMGFCSSVENSLELCPSSLISSTGPASSGSAITSFKNEPNDSQDVNRHRTSPLLRNLTEGRPKPSTSPIKNPRFVPKSTTNRWSSSSTIRLVSILNNSTDERPSLEKSGHINPAADLRTKLSDRRVRILENTTKLNRSTLSTDHKVNRHSLPADLITRSLMNSSEIENRGTTTNSKANNVKQLRASNGLLESSQPPSAPDWVVVKPDSSRSGNGEQNVRRWSLRASAILSTHPKIV